MITKGINTVALFSGGGGLDLGFAAAGYNIVFTSDIDPYSCKTLEINQGKRPFVTQHPVVVSDVATLNKLSIEKASGFKSESVELMIGGPPCQAFSVFGKRKGLEDPRGNLVWEYARLINETKPVAFLLENVPGIKSIHGGELFEHLLSVLTFDGEYKVTFHDYQMADYGIPQFRHRVFIIGNRIGKDIPEMKQTHFIPESCKNGTKKYRTVAEVLSEMTEPEDNKVIPNHKGRKHSQRIVDRYTSLEYGERDHRTRINKLNPQKPSFTIIVGSDAGGGKGHIHPYTPRELTPRESARIQTFPDWWEFYGTGRHLIRQVGNAVPPLFAAQLAAHLAIHLFDKDYLSGYDKLVSALELNFLK